MGKCKVVFPSYSNTTIVIGALETLIPNKPDTMAEDLDLGKEIGTMLEKEVGFMGPLLMNKQCKDMGVKPEDLRPSHMKQLSGLIYKVVLPMVGEARAAKMQKDIMEYARALETLDARPSKSAAGGEVDIEAELTVADGKLGIGHLDEAERAARRAVSGWESSGADVKARLGPSVLRTLAKVLTSKREWREEAAERYEQACELAKSAGDKYEEAMALNGLGLMAWRVADHKEALQFHRRALKAIEGLPVVSKADRIRINGARMRIHMGLGNVYLDLIQMEKAIEHDQKAIEIAKSMESWNEVGLIYNNMARVYEEMRDFRSAIDNYERGIQFLHKGKGARMEGWAMTNLAGALVEVYKGKEAKPHLEKAERLLADFTDPIAHSKLNCMWGKYHRSQKEWDAGIKRFQRSIDVIANENSPDYMATAQEEFGTMYLEKGDREKAREYLELALEWQKKKGDAYRVAKIKRQLEQIK